MIIINFITLKNRKIKKDLKSLVTLKFSSMSVKIKLKNFSMLRSKIQLKLDVKRSACQIYLTGDLIFNCNIN